MLTELFDKLMSQSPLLQGGLILMIAGWMGYQLRSLPERIWGFCRWWTTRIVQVREAHPHYEHWLAFLTERAVRKDGPRTLEVRSNWENGEAVSTLSAGTDDFWARVHGKWCHVHVCREDSDGKASLTQRFLIVVEMLASSRRDVRLLADEVAKRATVVEHRQLVDLYNRHGGCVTIKIPKRNPETLCLPRGLFESVEQRLCEFCGAREQYEWAGIPWRFGVLLHGEPGTGKTSLAHSLASRLGLRIAVITLADFESDREMVEVFRCVQEQAVVLIEDVDCAFRQRDGGGEAAAGVSFSGFLNCIDGVMAPQNGRILVMTTNHLDRLDPALVRPGRVDLRIEVPTLARQDASDYADRVFPHVASRHDVVNEVMALERPTPAVLINRLTLQRWHRPARAGASESSTPRPEIARA
ncbi:MAG TPA: AAA family ATPase [Phycisphaerales bacterium]|nr:AAA family ATPase [Phycisphaerales bacterium]